MEISPKFLLLIGTDYVHILKSYNECPNPSYIIDRAYKSYIVLHHITFRPFSFGENLCNKKAFSKLRKVVVVGTRI